MGSVLATSLGVRDGAGINTPAVCPVRQPDVIIRYGMAPAQGPPKGGTQANFFWTFRGPEKEDVKYVLLLDRRFSSILENQAKRLWFAYVFKLIAITFSSRLLQQPDLDRSFSHSSFLARHLLHELLAG